LDFTSNLKDLDRINDTGRLFSILADVMKKLRSPEGCMWDREQNHKTIKRNLIEEAYEVVENIENENSAGLREELGDLLLQVVFHSQIAADNKEFDINDVIKGIINKLVRRHPHVFQNVVLNSSKEILTNWEEIKKEERKEKKDKSIKSDSIFSGIPRSLPSLHFAFEIQNRASRLGFDWENAIDVLNKIKEELGELEEELKKDDRGRISDEIGDILFAIVNFGRYIGIDCEESLNEASKKFIRRFDFMEKYARDRNLDFKALSLKEKDKLWKIAKRELP
jgi:tetrapyrrole methylase family protein/MazG family protein